LSEEQGDAPERSQTNKRVYHATDRGRLPAEKPGDYVEAEQADAAPVQTAYYCKYQRNAIHYHASQPPFGLISCIACPRRAKNIHTTKLVLFRPFSLLHCRQK